MTQILDAYADKDVAAILEGSASVRSSVEREVAQYLEAVRRNGYDPKRVMQEALSKSRQRFNMEVYQELRSGNPSDKKIEALAIRLQRLDSSLTRNLFRSLETRFDVGNRFFEPEYRQSVVRAWHKARAKGESPFVGY